LLSGDREGLTGKSGRDNVNQSLICCGVPVTVECSDIAEDWCVGENSIFDPLFDNTLAVVVPLDVPDRLPAEQLRPEQSAADTGE
jgi:hypothetical protein